MEKIKPKVGEIWKLSINGGNGLKVTNVHCSVIEDDGELLGIWFAVPWGPKLMDDVEDGKDGWKRVYEPKHVSPMKHVQT